MSDESTAPDLVELARRLREAFNRGEFDLALTFYAPDAVLDTSPMGLEELKGHAAIRQGWVDALNAYAAFNLSEEGRTDLGNGVILTVLVVKGLLSDTGADLNMRYAQVNEWCNGLIARETLYTDLDEARAAAERLAQERGKAVAEEPSTLDLVELVRKQAEAANRRDLDAFTNAFAEDATIDGQAVGGFLYEGRAAINRFVEDWFDAFEELHVELEEVSHLGNGVVFAVVIQDGRLIGSAGHIRQREGWVVLWARDLITRVATYHVDEGRAAAERLAEERG